MQFFAVGCALGIWRVLESLDAQEWGSGQKMNVCGGVSLTWHYLRGFFRKMLKARMHIVAGSF